MGKLADAFVEIRADLQPLRAGLQQAKGLLEGFVASGSKVLDGLKFGAGMALFRGLETVGKAFLGTAKDAANLGESVSKVQVTFGAAAGGMIAQADDLARRFGTVKQETLDAAAAFGLMGLAAGLSRDRAADLGKGFVKLGLDLASYHNISNQEAFTKLRAGLAGESEPLRPLGIMLSEDAVKAEALAMGLVKVNTHLTEQEKILARTSLISRQAGAAGGDLERTQDSAANQMRRLQGDLVNATVEFGKGLQGALLDAIKLARELGAELGKAGVTPASVGKEIGFGLQGIIGAQRMLGQASLADLGTIAEAQSASILRRVGLVSRELEARKWGPVAEMAERGRTDLSAAATEPSRGTARMAYLQARLAEARAEGMAEATAARGVAEGTAVRRIRESSGASGALGIADLFKGAGSDFKSMMKAAAAEGDPQALQGIMAEQRQTLGSEVGGALQQALQVAFQGPLRALTGRGALEWAGVADLATAQKAKPKFAAEVLQGQEAYATRAIQMAYEASGKEDETKELVTVQKQAKADLGGILDHLRTIVTDGIKTIGGVRPL